MVAFSQFLIYFLVGAILFLVFKFLLVPAWRQMMRNAQEKEKQDAMMERIRKQNEAEESESKVQATEELKDYLDGNSPNR